MASYDQLILLCAHYEGVDDRIRSLVDEEISLGDFILTGGEIPAMAVVDSVIRLLPGVLEKRYNGKTNPFLLLHPMYLERFLNTRSIQNRQNIKV